ncbi:hypothetical protein AB835_10630 [Candidatus Endobugula sertula]|uniref:Histidine phosphatase family protein n=1 Tax=Candidatus Endobugula sertula TaxID=62101 RepID=A0A1D2QNG3_9GAMM|nr:hypothetical protein AB835_10630 [Candidatus Endobugula sertula]
MTNIDWQLPPSTVQFLQRAPANHAVAVLLRHSVRQDHLPLGEAGDSLPITLDGRQLGHELGTIIGERLQSIYTSPVVRCVQTAEVLQRGAGTLLPVTHDRMLGDPGVYIMDTERAGDNWKCLGNEGVIQHMILSSDPLPGMVQSDKGAHVLMYHLLSTMDNVAGVHVFVTHDSILSVTVARLLKQSFCSFVFPQFLEAAFFWETHKGVHIVYQNVENIRAKIQHELPPK